MIAGVCAGIGDRFNIKPATVRIAFVVLSFFTSGFPILVYVALAIFLPEEQKRVPFNSQNSPSQYAEPTVRYKTKTATDTPTPSYTPPNVSKKTSTSTPPSSIDINNGSEKDLYELPGLTKLQVKHLIEARNARGGFQSIKEIGDVLGLKPHVLTRLQNIVEISPMRGNTAQQSGRRLDL